MRHTIVILAGGKGTRLGDLTKDCPKPMVDINGEPFLAKLVRHYRKQGFSRFIISTGYLADKILKYNFGPGVTFDPDWCKDSYLRYYFADLFTPKWVVNGDTFIPDPLPEIEGSGNSVILSFDDTDAGAQFVALGKIRIQPVSAFYDIGTPVGLEAFREYAKRTGL